MVTGDFGQSQVISERESVPIGCAPVMVGGAWYFLQQISTMAASVTNFLILQLNSTLQDVSENI